jgi:plastocyanin
VVEEGVEMTNRKKPSKSRWLGNLTLGACAAMSLAQADAQTEQRVEVRIRDFTFIASQAPLMLNAPAVIAIRNEDGERHNFESPIFQGIATEVETGGVITYGRGIGGVFVEPNASAAIRFTVKRPGRYEFKCTIHPNMRGELLLLNIQAV